MQSITGRDIYLQRSLERFHDADCGVSQLLVTKTEFQRNEIYSGWLVPSDVGPMIWTKLAEKPGYHASISITRPNQAAYFEASELELLTALAPHLRQALWLNRTLRTLESSNAMLSRGIDEMGIAIGTVRQDGSILRSTEGAERLFSAQNGVSLKNGRLHVAHPKEQRALDALIAGACATGANRGANRGGRAAAHDSTIRIHTKAAGNATIGAWTSSAGGAILVTRKPPLRPLQVVVSPFASGSQRSDLQATALIHFSDPYANPRPRGEILCALYGLTPTESRLADLLLDGMEVQQIADRMKTTLQTARVNLKRVLAKTDTHRQSELMRLMLSLPGR